MGAAFALALLSLCQGIGHAQEQEGVLKPPKMLQFYEADYPKDKHAAGITAKVLLSIEIGDDGKVAGVEVLESGGADFDVAAVAAAKKFQFSPAEANGQPIPVKITYRYDFTIVTKLVSLGPQVNFDGVVLDRFKKSPLANATVKLKDLDISTKTDDQGAFAFTDLAPGSYKVEIRHPRTVTVLTEETIKPGQKRTMKYFVEQKEEDVDEEVVVRATRIKKEAVETRIRTEEARKVPGTQGDTLKVVQNLPGVGRASFGSGQLVVWGSSAKETRVNVEGVEIPALYHMGGLRSTVNSDLVKSIDLSPGAYGAEFGRGLGGLVRVELAPLPTAGTRGYVAADVLDTSAQVSTALTNRIRLSVAGRYSYLDRIMQNLSSKDIGDFFPIPRYDDYQAKLAIAFRRDEELSFTFLGADDNLRRTIPASDPADQRTQDNETKFQRLIMTYSRLFDDGSSVRVTPSVGHDRQGLWESFGGVGNQLQSDSWQYGLRAGLRRRVAKWGILSLGMDAQGRTMSLSRRGSMNQPPREGDLVVFGQRPSSDLNSDDWKVGVWSLGAYAMLDIKLGNFSLTPGLRFEPSLVEGNHRYPKSATSPYLGYANLDLAENPLGVPVIRDLPNPRLQVAWRGINRLTLLSSMGIYGQPVDPEDMSPVFGNPGIHGSRAIHLTAGFSYKLRNTLTLETMGYYKSLRDLVSRSANPSPAVGESLTQDGTGRVRGLQVLLRQEMLKGFFGWISYSLSKSERRDHPNLAYRLFDQDQTHVLALLASYDLGKGFEVGARFRYATGMPRTPVVDSYRSNLTGNYEPVLGAQNSIRIPSFYQLDARAEKVFVMGPRKISVFLDVQNLTNRKNPEEFAYSENYQTRKFITGLPALAVVGGRLDF